MGRKKSRDVSRGPIWCGLESPNGRGANLERRRVMSSFEAELKLPGYQMMAVH